VERYGLNIDVDAQMSRLNPSQIYMLGIAVAAESDPAVLILDEPTVGCTDREIDAIFSLMSGIADRPAVVVLITHKLRDVFRVAETALVMRRGQAVAHLEVANTTTAEVSRLILGDRSAAAASSVASTEPDLHPPLGSPALEGGGEPTSQSATTSGPDSAEPDGPTAGKGLVVVDVGLVRRGRVLLREVSFSVRPKEILGIIGIRENGLDWLEEVVSGMSPPSEGRVRLDGRDVTEATPSELRRCGLAYIPTDRLSRGASLGSSVTENLIVTSRRGMHRYGVLHRGEVSAYAERRKADLDIRGGLGEPLYRLSGGNIQKVILSRELSGSPAVLVFAEPSWGLDIATRSEVFRRLRRLRDEGTAVLLLTTDLDEVLELADRIAVVHDGSMVPMPAGADRRTIGDAMLGVNAG
jgi:simple sugar transport system ATP-binding protein